MSSLTLVLAAVAARAGSLSAQQQTGRIVGRIVEAAQGAPLAGAQVEVVGLGIRATSALDGRYTLQNVPAGTVSLAVRYIGFTPKTVTGLVVPGGAVVEQNVSLASQVITLEEVTVTAAAERGSVDRALDEQRNATNIVNAISAEQIARSPDGDAAQAMQRVSGVSVQDGKYVFVRGLGERYTTTSLNGVRLPSPEPDRKVVPLDLFPSNLLEGITTSKTFTPDQQGDFAGASVDLKTKEFPGRPFLSFSLGGGFNSEATGQTLLSDGRTGGEWLGFASGSRSLPSAVRDANFNALNQDGFNSLANAFRNRWATRSRAGYPNGSFGASLGGTAGAIGYTAALSYTVAQEIKKDLFTSLIIDRPPEAQNKASGSAGTTSVLWGGIVNLSANLGSTSRLTWNNTYNRTSDDEARQDYGFNENLDVNLQRTTLRFIERSVLSSQLASAHLLGGRHQLELNAAFSRVTRNEPDRSDLVYAQPTDLSQPLSWLSASADAARRTYAGLNEHGLSGGGNLRFSLGDASSLDAIKVGVFGRTTDRDAENLQYSILGFGIPSATLALAPEQLFDGRLSQPGSSFLRVQPIGQGGSYTAKDRLAAGYAMLDRGLASRVRVIAGARVEYADIQVVTTSIFGTQFPSTVRNTDVLPSLALTYAISDNQNLRLSGSRTVSRPEYRELSVIQFRDVLGGVNVQGNAALRRSRAWNFDARWEYFPAAGEVISVSAFGKIFNDPIERVERPTSGSIVQTFVNAERAVNYGVELEFRKRLGRPEALGGRFTLFTNATLIRSRITIGNDSIVSVTNNQRALVGQAPYTVNAGLTFASPSGGFSATALYNVVGSRIVSAGAVPLPDVYEQPRHLLDLSLRFPIVPGFSGKLDARNLLDAPFRVLQGPVVRERYTLGRVVGVGFSWQP